MAGRLLRRWIWGESESRSSEEDAEVAAKRLASMLRDRGEEIFDGSKKLNVSAKTFAALTQEFEKVFAGRQVDQEGDRSFEVLLASRESKMADVEFLHDALQKVVSINISRPPSPPQPPGSSPSYSSAACCLKLHKLRSLKSLEMSRVPLAEVFGLQQLRSQLRLLTVTRGCDNIKELICACGGDDSTAFSWSELKLLNLSHNKITELDDCLRLLPVLEYLDVSSNDIAASPRELACHLAYLTELRHLDLGNNALTAAPVDSGGAAAPLHAWGRNLASLRLNGNRIESLQGVELLLLLTKLDISDNCLMVHAALKPLSKLPHLHALDVRGNPLAHHREHRLRTVGNLHRQAIVRTFTLDGSRLSRTEVAFGAAQQPAVADRHQVVGADRRQVAGNGSGHAEVDADVQETIVENDDDDGEFNLYILAMMVDEEDTTTPVTVITTNSQMFVCRENHHRYPPPRNHNKMAAAADDDGGRHFEVVHEAAITDVASLLLEDECLTVELFSGEVSALKLKMATCAARDSLQDAISGPWRETFGIQLQVKEAEKF